MKNMEIKQEKGKLVITVDTTKQVGPSKSGKTTIIATTSGNKEVKDGIYVGLNVYKYN